MPITFICPICSQQATVGNHLAGAVTSCPLCSNAVRIPDVGQIQRPPAAPPPPRDYPPQPERNRDWERHADYRRRDYEERRERDYPSERDFRREEESLHPGWKTVRTGLTLVRLSIVIAIFTILGLLVLGLILAGTMQAPRLGPRLAEIVGGILGVAGGLTILGCTVLMFVGEGMCCAAPVEARGRGLALGAIICHGLVILVCLALLVLIISFERRFNVFRELGTFLFGSALLVNGLIFTWQLLFILFLSAVARAFENERLAQSINGFLTFHCIESVGGFLWFIMVRLLANGPAVGNRAAEEGLDTLKGCGAILLFVGALVDLVWFLSILVRTRANIGTRYYRPRRYDY
jgi:hypothetical protein